MSDEHKSMDDEASETESSVPKEGVVGDSSALESAQELEALLTKLADVARRSGMRSLAAEVSGERLSALREGRLTVIVLGEFNHGKSTLINAFLGSDAVLPTGITPTTAVITHIRYAEHPHALIHYDDQDRVEIDLTSLDEVVTETQDVDPRFVEVGVPAEVLKGNLVLVDTPGVNDISQQRVEITYGYLPRADVIVYVLDANQVLKNSEIRFIQDRLLKHNRDRLIFVLGKIDTLSLEEREEVEAYTREKLLEYVDCPEVYPLSASRALDEGDEGFDVFREHLLSYLNDRKSFILIDSGVSGGLRIAGMLRQNLAIKRRGYALDHEELERRVASVRARIGDARRAIRSNVAHIDERTKGLKATAQHNLKEFASRFAASLPAEIERASATDVKNYLADWIRDTYKVWLEEEGHAIARELEQLAQDVIETTNRNLGEAVEAVQEELGLSPERVDLEVDSMVYDVSVLAVGVLGLSAVVLGSLLAGGLLLITAPVLAVVFKEKLEAKIKERAVAQGQNAIMEISVQVDNEMVRVIEDHGEQLKCFVEAAGDRLYRQVNEALEQALKDTADKNIDRSELDQRAEDCEAEVEVLVQALVRVRESLFA